MDERAFEREVAARGVDQRQHRSRWRPNHVGPLARRPGAGMHATD